MKVLIGIQARSDSKRLPSKVMLPLWDKTVIQHVYDSCTAVKTEHEVIVSVLIPLSDRRLATLLKNRGLNYLAIDGNENDLVKRYLHAAEHYKADKIVRVTGDCVLITPTVIEACLRPSVDYMSNTFYRSMPEGLDVQVVSRKGLEWFDENQIRQREHPFKPFDENADVRQWFTDDGLKYGLFANASNEIFLHTSLDTEEDYENLQKFKTREEAWQSFSIEP